MYPIMELTTKINLKKKRVVFDRSVQFQRKSINGEPVLEIYLTNQILSVLLKFQQQEATDIEAMFYQIKIPRHQRSYLRFLWLKDGHLVEGTIDHETCAHVFEDTLSLSCSNYALKRRTADKMKKNMGIKHAIHQGRTSMLMTC